MFTAREFTKMGLTRNSSRDFRNNGISYHCYMWGDLGVFYSKHDDMYILLIKIPYQNYNFTYEEAMNTDWFKYSTGLYGVSDTSAEEIMNHLEKVRKGVEDLESKVTSKEINTNTLNSAYRDEIHAAKVTMKQFNDSFDWIHADDDIRHTTTKAYKILQKIVGEGLPDYSNKSLREQRVAFNLLTKYGYINSTIHNNISILLNNI